MRSGEEPKVKQDALRYLADALGEDIVNTSEENLLAEVAEDFGERSALALAFDEILARQRSMAAVRVGNLADALSEDIATTSQQALLNEIAEDFGDPRTLAIDFDHVFDHVMERGPAPAHGTVFAPVASLRLGANRRAFFPVRLPVWLLAPLRSRTALLGAFAAVLLAVVLAPGIYQLLVERSARQIETSLWDGPPAPASIPPAVPAAPTADALPPVISPAAPPPSETALPPAPPEPALKRLAEEAARRSRPPPRPPHGYVETPKLAASAPPAFAGQTPLPWVARHGLSSAAFDEIGEIGKDGFELTSVSGYVANGDLRYVALWRKPASPEPWAARHGLMAVDFQKAIDDLAKDGLSLVYVAGYEVSGTPLFAGIWRKSAAGLPVVRLDMDSAKYQAEFDSLLKEGFRLQHVAGYTHNGAAVYAAIWNKSGGPEFVERHGLTSAQYQQAFDDFFKQGFRLKEVSGYSPGAVDYYAAIWEKGGDGAPWIARYGVPLADYQTQFDADRFQAWQPLYVQAFTSGGSARFNTIWERSQRAAAPQK
jgi:hypothetical protein